MAADRDVTGLLQNWRRGDKGALGQLVPIVEGELRRIARGRLGKAPAGSTLSTTSLVQEAYLRLITGRPLDWQGRTHFFAVCAEIMRHILVDHARAHMAAKRGGGMALLPLDEELVISEDQFSQLVAIDEALEELAKIDPRKTRVVELRFFGGLTVEETAEALSVSAETVMRDWRLAKMWLLRQMDTVASRDPGGMASH